MSRSGQKNNPRVDEVRKIKARYKHLRRDDDHPMNWMAKRDADNKADMQSLNLDIDSRALPKVK